MDYLTVTLLSVVTPLVVYYLVTKKENKYPPGPFSFPFVANLPQFAMAGSLPKFAEKYKKKYGNVRLVMTVLLSITNAVAFHCFNQHVKKIKPVTSVQTFRHRGLKRHKVLFYCKVVIKYMLAFNYDNNNN